MSFHLQAWLFPFLSMTLLVKFTMDGPARLVPALLLHSVKSLNLSIRLKHTWTESWDAQNKSKLSSIASIRFCVGATFLVHRAHLPKECDLQFCNLKSSDVRSGDRIKPPTIYDKSGLVSVQVHDGWNSFPMQYPQFSFTRLVHGPVCQGKFGVLDRRYELTAVTGASYIDTRPLEISCCELVLQGPAALTFTCFS
jgi:hypothetical protein